MFTLPSEAGIHRIVVQGCHTTSTHDSSLHGWFPSQIALLIVLVSHTDRLGHTHVGRGSLDLGMEGYSRLDRLMGDHPNYAIFRRFGTLNTENLLYLQAEIQELELDLWKQQKEDRESGHPDWMKYVRYWLVLKESGEADAEPGNNHRQRKLILKIRAKIKEYSKR